MCHAMLAALVLLCVFLPVWLRCCIVSLLPGAFFCNHSHHIALPPKVLLYQLWSQVPTITVHTSRVLRLSFSTLLGTQAMAFLYLLVAPCCATQPCMCWRVFAGARVVVEGSLKPYAAPCVQRVWRLHIPLGEPNLMS